MDNKSTNNANGQVSLIAFIQRFPDNLSALLYLEEIRWHGKQCCPHCQSERVTLTDGNLRKYWCSTCRKRFSPTVNTIFHSHKIGLNIFFYAVWEVINSRKGIASVKLAKTLGVSQPTAWLILSRIRKAMEQNDLFLFPLDILPP